MILRNFSLLTTSTKMYIVNDIGEAVATCRWERSKKPSGKPKMLVISYMGCDHRLWHKHALVPHKIQDKMEDILYKHTVAEDEWGLCMKRSLYNGKSRDSKRWFDKVCKPEVNDHLPIMLFGESYHEQGTWEYGYRVKNVSWDYCVEWSAYRDRCGQKQEKARSFANYYGGSYSSMKTVQEYNRARIALAKIALGEYAYAIENPCYSNGNKENLAKVAIVDNEMFVHYPTIDGIVVSIAGVKYSYPPCDGLDAIWDFLSSPLEANRQIGQELLEQRRWL